MLNLGLGIRIKVLALVLLGFMGVQIWRAALAVQQAVALPDLAGISPLWYVAVSSGLWALVFAICLLMVFRQVRFAPVAAILAGVLNQAHVWLDRLLFNRSTESMQTLGFAGLLSVLFLIALCLPAALLNVKSMRDKV